VLVVGALTVYLGVVQERAVRLEGVLDHAKEGLLGLDGEGGVEWVNLSGAKLLGWDLRAEAERALRGRAFLGGVLKPMGGDPFRGSDLEEVPVCSGFFNQRDGELLEVSYSCRALPKKGYVVSFADMTQENHARKEAWALARTDELTGLANRRRIMERVGELMDGQGSRFTVFFIDLDRFKEVNDQLGHEAGDYVLMEVAYRLQGVVRAGDLVGRLGGDEFLVLISNELTIERRREVAQRLVEEVSAPVVYRGTALPISASVGVTRYPEDGISFEELSAQADVAMYEVKQAGRNGYRLFDASMARHAMRRQVVQSRLELLEVAPGPMPAVRLMQMPRTIPEGGCEVSEGVLEWEDEVLGAVSSQEVLRSIPSCGLGMWEEFYLRGVLSNVDGFEGLLLLTGVRAEQVDELFVAKLEGLLQEYGQEGRRLAVRLESRQWWGEQPDRFRALCERIKGLGCGLWLDARNSSLKVEEVCFGLFDYIEVPAVVYDRMRLHAGALLQQVEERCSFVVSECSCEE